MSQLPSISQLNLHQPLDYEYMAERPAKRHRSMSPPRQIVVAPKQQRGGTSFLLTPPNSDQSRALHSFKDAPIDEGDHDSELFSGVARSPESNPQSPPTLFASAPAPLSAHKLPAQEPRMPSSERNQTYDKHLLAIISKHKNNLYWQRFGNLLNLGPSDDEYKLVLDFVSRFRYETEQFEQPSQGGLARRQKTSSRHKPRKVSQDSSSVRRAVVSHAPVFEPGAIVEEFESESQVQHHRQQSSASARRRSTNKTIGSAAKEAKSARAKSSKPQKSDNYLDYPDFCPPFSAMKDPMAHTAKGKDYGSGSLDYENDELAGELHEAELELARRLHITCKKYLCVKRQLFEEFVKLMRNESEKQANWNKTAAQRVSNVDVTKTSIVWQFFSDVGWFDKSLFTKYTDKNLDLRSEYYSATKE